MRDRTEWGRQHSHTKCTEEGPLCRETVSDLYVRPDRRKSQTDKLARGNVTERVMQSARPCVHRRSGRVVLPCWSLVVQKPCCKPSLRVSSLLGPFWRADSRVRLRRCKERQAREEGWLFFPSSLMRGRQESSGSYRRRSTNIGSSGLVCVCVCVRRGMKSGVRSML